MTIEKLIKGGEIIAPATTTTAVIDPGTKMSLHDLLMEAIPLETGEIIDNEVIEVGKTTEVKYTFVTRWRGREVTPLCSYEIDGMEISGKSYTASYTPQQPGDIEITVKSSYNGFESVDKFKVVATYPSYFGAMSQGIPTAEDIKKLESHLYGYKHVTLWDVNLTDQIYVYAYPKYMGDLSCIKDRNGFCMMCKGIDGSTFKKTEVTIDSIPYNVYYMESPCTIRGFQFKCKP